MNNIFESVFVTKLSTLGQKQDAKERGDVRDAARGLNLDKGKRVNSDFWRRLDKGGVTGSQRKSQNLVPQCHKPDQDAIPEFELAKKACGPVPCSPPSVQKLIKLFNLQNLDHEHEKMLGNTGIVLFFNPNNNSYFLKS